MVLLLKPRWMKKHQRGIPTLNCRTSLWSLMRMGKTLVLDRLLRSCRISAPQLLTLTLMPMQRPSLPANRPLPRQRSATIRPGVLQRRNFTALLLAHSTLLQRRNVRWGQRAWLGARQCKRWRSVSRPWWLQAQML